MNPAIVAASSLACLLLTASIYYCNILSGHRSWLRSEMLAMILLSLLVGLLPLALVGTVIVLVTTLSTPFDIRLSDLGFELAAVGSIVASVLLFRALIIATYRRERAKASLPPRSPQTPRRPDGTPSANTNRSVASRKAA